MSSPSHPVPPWMQVAEGGSQPKSSKALSWLSTPSETVVPLVLPVRAGSPPSAVGGPEGEAGAQAVAGHSRDVALEGADPSTADGTTRQESSDAASAEQSDSESCEVCEARGEALEAAQEAFVDATRQLLETEQRVAEVREKELLFLSCEVARALIEGLAEDESDIHVALIRAALQALDGEAPVRVRVGEEAYAALTPELGQGGELYELSAHITSDSELEGLGCIVENDEARVDGRLDGRLARIREALAGAWSDFRESPSP